jgi:hypothetical protein
MKYTVATCAHLLAVVQWWLVDVARGSVARGVGGARCEARGADSARHRRGASHAARSAGRMRRMACLVRPCEVRDTREHVARWGGAGACTRGGSVLSCPDGRPYRSITDKDIQ